MSQIHERKNHKMKKIVIALMVLAIGVSCISSVSAMNTAFGGAQTGQITSFFADFDPSAITEMLEGMDFSGILNDLGFGDISSLMGGDFDISSLLGGVDLSDLLGNIIPGGNDPATPATTAPTQTPTIAPSTEDDYVCPKCGHKCHCDTNCTCAPGCVCNPTTAPAPSEDDYVCPKCGHKCHCDTNCTCAPGCVCNPTTAPSTTETTLPKTGETANMTGIVLGIMAIAGAAYIVTSTKRKEQ